MSCNRLAQSYGLPVLSNSSRKGQIVVVWHKSAGEPDKIQDSDEQIGQMTDPSHLAT